MLPEEYYCPDQNVAGIPAFEKKWQKASRRFEAPQNELVVDGRGRGNQPLAAWKVPWTGVGAVPMSNRSGGARPQAVGRHLPHDASRSRFACKAVHGHSKLYRTLYSRLRPRLNSARLPRKVQDPCAPGACA